MKYRKHNNQKHLQSNFIFNNLATGLQLAKHEILQIFIIVYLFYNASRRPATLLKRDSNTGVFLWILRNFQEHLFYRKPPVAAAVSVTFKVSHPTEKGVFVKVLSTQIWIALVRNLE